MSCCAPGTEGAAGLEETAGPSAEEIRLSARDLGDGICQTDLSVPDMYCGACMVTIEKGLGKLDFVEEARVNLSTRRVMIKWRDGAGDPAALVETLGKLGYKSNLFETSALGETDARLSELVRSLAVAGFAASNIMLLSVSVWSGAEDATRDLFHWVSALIAAPALAYSGRVFFRSAFAALKGGHLNMDVPISLAVLLAFAMSFWETINHGENVWFDASITLLFFLLVGRTLDHVMRERARKSVTGLARLAPRGAMVIGADGGHEYRPAEEIRPGEQVLLATGERVPVDALVLSGQSDLDCSLVNGESVPQPVREGSEVKAGTLNLTGPLTLKATAAARDSFLSEMISLMEAAEGGKARYRRIADRAAAIYAPAVHLVALVTFLGWLLLGAGFHASIYTAIAVLIITCPCALGIAVPIVQVVAAGRLFERGIMVKDGGGLERLAEVDTVVFDKTGTLTQGRPRVVEARGDDRSVAAAVALARHSRHPLSRAIAESAVAASAPAFDSVEDMPGSGMVARSGDTVWKLGRAEWALGAEGAPASDEQTVVVLSRDGEPAAHFVFEDRLRLGAESALAELKERGLELHMVSGDRQAVVDRLAARLGIDHAKGGVLPGAKADYVAALASSGRKVLMVGDGINDAPALAAAHTSMAPSGAADIGRAASDFVFLRDSLEAVPFAHDTAVRSGRLIRENFGIAIAYNLVAVPLAIAGLATPLLAALAMSSSSIVVVANALRLKLNLRGGQRAPATTGTLQPAE
ncbi:MAG: cadmium-translocating P-type ATPase [Notoacmeibacter sp.]|nr:cadmium-translocating P-type ATPase [Notoacmeibacter sp.]